MVLEVVSSACGSVVKLDIDHIVRLLVRDINSSDHVEG